MSALLTPARRATGTRRINCQEAEEMWESGELDGRNVILIDGELIDMPMPGPIHEAVVSLVAYVLMGIFRTGYFVRANSGLTVTDETNPRPDVAVIEGSPRDYLIAHPNRSILIVEVSHTTLSFDRNQKAAIYAAAGVPEYWIVDIEGRQVFVNRDPQADTNETNGTYRTIITYRDGDTFAPLAAPQSVIRVADLLP